MKRFIQYIIASILLLSACPSMAQTVGYSYKLLATKGCTMKFSVVKQDSAYFIIVTASSLSKKFLNETMMKIRTFNDDVITLKGVAIDKQSAVIAANLFALITENNSTAQFAITPDDFEKLNSGVSKIHLSMMPTEHERTFKKDKIGKKLYQFYLKAKAKDENF